MREGENGRNRYLSIFIAFNYGISLVGGNFIRTWMLDGMRSNYIVPLTPTKKDDEVLAWILRGKSGKILKAILSFAPIQKKEKK